MSKVVEDLIPVNENEVAIVEQDKALVLNDDDGSQYIMALNGDRKISYTSIDKDKLSFKEKAKFVNTISGEAISIKDVTGTKILLKDIYIEIVKVSDIVTKEQKTLPRTILIAVDGKTYTTCSPVFAGNLATLINNMGHPKEWEEPLPIIFKKIRTKNGFDASTFQTAF